MEIETTKRFAASVIIKAFQELHPLLARRRTDLQYFDAVDAFVWLAGPASDLYFETLGLDADRARLRIDLPFFAALILEQLDTHRGAMLRLYVAMARYSLQGKERRGEARIPYEKLTRFAEDALKYSLLIVTEASEAPPGPIRETEHIIAMLAIVTAGAERIPA